MKAMVSKIASVLVGFTLFFSAAAAAITPTPQQIEQFKKLPIEQQRALAKQYGVDLDSVGAIGGNSAIPPPVVDAPTITPRDVKPKDTILEQSISESTKQVTLEEKKEERTVDQKLDQFGYELFAGSPSTFAPVTNVPVPSEYIVGPGDTVVVQLYGKTNATHELSVTREGIIQFPDVGPLTVMGLNFEELKSFIVETVSQKMIGVNTSISMGALRSIQIFVLGEAFRPGTYTVSSLATMTNALYVSGGVTKIGSLRNVQLKRNGKLINTLDLYDLLLKGDTSKDSRLLPGDVIFIPPIGKTIGVKGEVRRPAIYELKKESKAEEIIDLAGGFLPTAFPAATRIDRINAKGQRTLVDADLTQSSGLNLSLRDGDVIQIFPVLDKVEGVVLISGHIQRSGAVSWRRGMRVTDIVASANDLSADPDLNYALIKREVMPGRTIEVHSIKLSDAFASYEGRSNVVLQARDEIIIFPRATDERTKLILPLLEALKSQAGAGKPAKVVMVSGNVRFPGEYPLTENMSTEDLLNAAGGLIESAYSIDAEITRSVVDSNQHQKIQRIQVTFTQQHTAGAVSSRAPLNPRDQLYVKRVPGWNEKEFAEIKGEVNFPGKYPIFRGDTLKTLIDRAGGLNEFAAPSSSIFLRDSLRQREAQQIEKYKQRLETDVAKLKVEATQSKENSVDTEKIGSSLLTEIVNAQATGRLVVDLVAILEDVPGSDVTLQNGDTLLLPRKPQEVSVIGEVQFPTSHLYRSGLGALDYIDNSGGLTPKSDEKYIYIISANGQVKPIKKGLFSSGNESVFPGDTVVVPYDVESMSTMSYWLNVSQILFQLSTTVAALNAVGAF